MKTERSILSFSKERQTGKATSRKLGVNML